MVGSHHMLVSMEIPNLSVEFFEASEGITVDVEDVWVGNVLELVEPHVDSLSKHANEVMASTQLFLGVVQKEFCGN